MPEVNSERTPPARAAAPLALGAVLDGPEGLDRLQLITLLRADQQRRWQAGQRVPAEDYLREVPALRDDPELAIDLIFSEFLLRRDVLREAPDLAEYLERFPQHATVLRHQLELDALAQEAVRTQGRGDRAPATVVAPHGVSDWTVLGQGNGPAAESPAGAPALPGYEVLGELGRGGMGLVLRGRDLHLGRDLAVKLLHEEYQGQPHLIRRFVNEARICGRLQHPGVVPVHALGALPDGRPYFTMKLVEGRTLADLLDDRADPAQDLPRLLAVFEQVCQAVAYAHSKGVIHRDLKPANVMVGAFGEVQVMDWGLAKVLGRDAEGPPAEGRAPAGEGPSHADRWLGTQLGHALGTLPYMPPEQARGEVGRMDERCDVFSLGAILCEILTGQPPISGRDAAELLARAKACDHAAALDALNGSGAGAELVRLAKSCLAAEPSARPRDAGVVAAAMTAYLAGVQERLRRAEVERAAAQARVAEARAKAAAERRARRWAVLLASSLLVIALLGGGGVWWWQRQQEERKRADAAQLQGVNSDLGEVIDKMRAWNLQEAEAALRRAEGRVASGGPPDLCGRVGQMRKDLALAGQLDRIRLDAAMWLDTSSRSRSADGDYATLFREQGLAVVGEEPPEVVATRINDSAIREQLVAALDDWAADTRDPARKAWLLAVARQAQPGEWGDRFRDPKLWANRAAVEQLAREADVEKLSPQLLVVLARVLKGVKGDPVPVLRAAHARHPQEFWVNFHLGNALGTSRPEEATQFFRAALALRPGTSAVHNNLGSALHFAGRLDEAIEEYRKALALNGDAVATHTNLGVALTRKRLFAEAVEECRRAIALDDTVAGAHTALGSALHDKGDVAGAIAEFSRAIALDPNLAEGHARLGLALREKKDLDGALAECRRAIALDSRNANGHYALGRTLHDKHDLAGALAEYRQAIALDPKLSIVRMNLGAALDGLQRLDEAVAEYHTALALDPKDAKLHDNLGNTLRALGRLEAAIAEYRRAIALAPQLPNAHNGLGAALLDSGDLDGAIAELRQAIALDPSNANPHNNLAAALYEKKDLDGAIAEFRQAIDLDPNDASTRRNLGVVLHDKGDVEAAIRAYRQAIALDARLASAHNGLGIVLLRAKQDADGAIAAFRKAVAIEPRDANAHANLGDALYDKRDLDGAIAAFRKALALDPKFAGTHAGLGNALHNKGDLDGAVAAYRQALALDPRDALVHNFLGVALRARNDLDGAVAEYRQAIALDPKSADAHNNLGVALYGMQDLYGAIAAFRRAITLNPRDAHAHNNLGGVLYNKGDLDGAIAAHQKAIELDPRDASAHRNLGAALQSKGRLDDAVARWRQAIALDANDVATHINLGTALFSHGRFAEASEAMRRCLSVLPDEAPVRPALARQLRLCDQLLPAEKRLPALLQGDALPATPEERLALSSWCQEQRHRYVASARFYADAFLTEPRLADDLGAGHRYNAACAAALAGCGQGEDAPRLPDKVAQALRRQALAWLRADLDAWGRRLDARPTERAAVRQVVSHWEEDADLAGVREQKGLCRLPEGERQEWRRLWDDVTALLDHAGAVP